MHRRLSLDFTYFSHNKTADQDCVDLSEPNKAFVAHSHPFTHRDELLSELRAASVFSTIDLSPAYHQLVLHEDSHDLTAFITNTQLFLYCRVPYSLGSASSAKMLLKLCLKFYPVCIII